MQDFEYDKVFNMLQNIANEIDGVNRSIEMPLSPTLNRTISASIKAGIIYRVSAGNYCHDSSTTSPASNSDAITVSAIADSDGKCGLGPRTALKYENSTDHTCIFQ